MGQLGKAPTTPIGPLHVSDGPGPSLPSPGGKGSISLAFA